MCIKTVTSKLYRLPYRVYCFLQKLYVTFRTLNSMFDCAPFDFDRRPLDNIQRSLLFKCHFWGIFCWIPTIWNTNFEHLKNGSEKEMQRKFKRIYEQQFMNAISIWNQKKKRTEDSVIAACVYITAVAIAMQTTPIICAMYQAEILYLFVNQANQCIQSKRTDIKNSNLLHVCRCIRFLCTIR